MEKDWKLFKKKLGGWQESYMDRLIEEYKDILNSDALSSDKYWTLRKKFMRIIKVLVFWQEMFLVQICFGFYSDYYRIKPSLWMI